MASNIVEILIGAKDDAKLDLDTLKAKLDELAHKVADAQVNVKGDKEAELALDRLGVKLTQIGKKTENPKISLEGAFKAATEITALDLALKRLGNTGGDGKSTGVFSKMSFGANTALEALGNLSTSGIAFINPLTIMLGTLAAIIAGPLLAALAPITLGFGVFGAVAVHEISKVITAHQQLQAAQQAYEKATTKAGRQSALAAEKAATEDLSGSEKGLLGMLTQLGQEFGKLEKSVQPEIMYSMYKALDIVKQLMPTLRVLVKAAAVAFADFMNNITNWLASDSGKQFLKWMRDDGPNAIKRFGNVMWDVARGVGTTFDFLRNAGDTWWQNVHAVISHVEHGWDGLMAYSRVVAHGIAASYHDLENATDAVRETFVRVGHDIESVFDGIKGAVSSAVSFIVGQVHTLEGALGSINGALGGIPGKVLGVLGLASGGISGAASGGVRSNLTMVGEHGPELVQLSAGSRVYNNSQTRQMMSGASGGNSYSISVSVAPGGHPAETGRQIVNAIREFERGSGKGWRS